MLFNVIRVPLAYILGKTSMGIYGIWLGVTIGGFMRGAAIFAWQALDARKRPKQDAATQTMSGESGQPADI